MNNRLNVSLRERHGLAYTVESNVTSYTDTGVASIYFGTDPKNSDKALALVHQELAKLRDVKLTTSQLAAAKKQAKGQLGVANDNREGLFLGLGKNYLRYNHYKPLSEVFDQIDGITAESLLEVANEVYAPDGMTTLVYE